MTKFDVVRMVHQGITPHPTADEWLTVRQWLLEYGDLCVAWGDNQAAYDAHMAAHALEETFGFCPW